jgi:AIPR protein
MKVPIQDGRDVQSLHYDSLRNISCSHDIAEGRRVLVGRALATEFLEFNTNENVRAYLKDAEGKKKRRRGDAHFKIEETTINYPENFCVLNGGIVIVSRDYEVDEKTKTLKLTRPSIINGAQTQGVLRDCSTGFQKSGEPFPEVYVTFEIIVTTDEPLIADISIARNFQNDAQNISITGSRGIPDDLEKALKSAIDTTVKIRKSETDRSDDFVDTEKVHDCAKENRAGPNAALYSFFLQIAPHALCLYAKWKSHQGFKGTRIRIIEREGGKSWRYLTGLFSQSFLPCQFSPLRRKMAG